MIQSRRVNGCDIFFALVDPVIDEIFAVYQPGATVKDIGQISGATAAINFNYANTSKGHPIGQLIVDGKVVNFDIKKTIPRAVLKWSVQGSPRLLRDGKMMSMPAKTETSSGMTSGSAGRFEQQ